MAGLALRSPLLAASGCAGRELDVLDPGVLARLGAVVTRSITLDPRIGAEPPRLVESASGLLQATGYPNPGLAGFLAQELPGLARAGARVIPSILGADVDELVELARGLGADPGVAAVEVHLRAPDAEAHGLYAARSVRQVGVAVSQVAAVLPPGVPVLAKIGCDPLDLVEAARAAADAGAGAVVVGGPVAAALPDGRPAGLGGPAIAPITLRCVGAVRRAVPGVDVVAGGGVAGPAEVAALLAAGAVAVQVGSAMLHDPSLPGRILDSLPTPEGPA